MHPWITGAPDSDLQPTGTRTRGAIDVLAHSSPRHACPLLPLYCSPAARSDALARCSLQCACPLLAPMRLPTARSGALARFAADRSDLLTPPLPACVRRSAPSPGNDAIVRRRTPPQACRANRHGSKGAMRGDCCRPPSLPLKRDCTSQAMQRHVVAIQSMFRQHISRNKALTERRRRTQALEGTGAQDNPDSAESRVPDARLRAMVG